MTWHLSMLHTACYQPKDFVGVQQEIKTKQKTTVVSTFNGIKCVVGVTLWQIFSTSALKQSELVHITILSLCTPTQGRPRIRGAGRGGRDVKVRRDEKGIGFRLETRSSAYPEPRYKRAGMQVGQDEEGGKQLQGCRIV